MMLLKAGRWQPIAAFEKWKDEVGPDGLEPSIEPLCKPVKELLSQPPPVKKEEEVDPPWPNVIDLTESDDEDVKPKIEAIEPPIPGPSQQPQYEDPIERIIHMTNRDDLDLSWLCEDDDHMSLFDLLDRLKVDQLKELVKQNKVKVGKGAKVSNPSPTALILQAR